MRTVFDRLDLVQAAAWPRRSWRASRPRVCAEAIGASNASRAPHRRGSCATCMDSPVGYGTVSAPVARDDDRPLGALERTVRSRLGYGFWRGRLRQATAARMRRRRGRPARRLRPAASADRAGQRGVVVDSRRHDHRRTRPGYELPDLRIRAGRVAGPPRAARRPALPARWSQQLREQGVLKNPPIVAASRPTTRPTAATSCSTAPTARPRRAPPACRTWWCRWCATRTRRCGSRPGTTRWSASRATTSSSALAALPGLVTARRRPAATRAPCSRGARRSPASSTPAAALITLHGGGDLHRAQRPAQRGGRHLPRPHAASTAWPATRSRRRASAHPDVTALVVFPHFEPAEVLELATQRRPAAGRHHAPPDPVARAARSTCRSSGSPTPSRSLEEKNRWLDEWLREKRRAAAGALLRGAHRAVRRVRRGDEGGRVRALRRPRGARAARACPTRARGPTRRWSRYARAASTTSTSGCARGLRGLDPEMPHILGNDVVGVIVEVGRGGAPPEARRPAVLVCPTLSCGVCAACYAGDDNLCRQYDVLGRRRNGGYAERVAVPGVNCLPYPENLSWERGGRGAARVPHRLAHAGRPRRRCARRGRAGDRRGQRRRQRGDPDRAAARRARDRHRRHRRQARARARRSARTTSIDHSTAGHRRRDARAHRQEGRRTW